MPVLKNGPNTIMQPSRSIPGTDVYWSADGTYVFRTYNMEHAALENCVVKGARNDGTGNATIRMHLINDSSGSTGTARISSLTIPPNVTEGFLADRLDRTSTTDLTYVTFYPV